MRPAAIVATTVAAILVAVCLIFVINPLCKELPLLPWQGSTRRKVFGIGLPRTGTSSLSRALEEMGLTVWHAPPLSCNRNLKNWVQRFDALTDVHTVSSSAFRDLLEAEPNALFILTTRNSLRWFRSVQDTYSSYSLCSRVVPGYQRMRRLALSLRPGDLENYNSNVIEHFCKKGKLNQLLLLDVTHPNAWSDLARFIGVSSSPRRFPYMGPLEVHAWQCLRYLFT